MGLDLEYDADIEPTSPEPCMYETIYLTAHKAACRASAFNSDGLKWLLVYSFYCFAVNINIYIYATIYTYIYIVTDININIIIAFIIITIIIIIAVFISFDLLG